MTTGTKITRATFKSFIRKNVGKTYVKVDSKFDGMIDCVREVDGEFALSKDMPNFDDVNTLGIRGVWLTGDDSFRSFEDAVYTGFYVFNCTGSFYLVTKK